MTVSMKMTAFWDTALCSLVEVNQQFRGAIITLTMQAVCTSETLVYFCEVTQRYIQKAAIFNKHFILCD
jgi:hypothetical protein